MTLYRLQLLIVPLIRTMLPASTRCVSNDKLADWQVSRTPCRCGRWWHDTHEEVHLARRIFAYT